MPGRESLQVHVGRTSRAWARLGVRVPRQQVGNHMVGRLGDRGAHSSAKPDPGEVVGPRA